LALREQLVLTSLGATSGGGLEDLFFALTGSAEQSGGAEPVNAAAFSETAAAPEPAPAPLR
ncbi:MAG: ABC transporter ATP-binding protein, partial [Brachybacterium sp.]